MRSRASSSTSSFTHSLSPHCHNNGCNASVRAGSTFSSRAGRNKPAPVPLRPRKARTRAPLRTIYVKPFKLLEGDERTREILTGLFGNSTTGEGEGRRRSREQEVQRGKAGKISGDLQRSLLHLRSSTSFFRHGSGERRGRRGLLVEEAGQWYQGDVWVQGGAWDVSNFCFGFDTRL